MNEVAYGVKRDCEVVLVLATGMTNCELDMR